MPCWHGCCAHPLSPGAGDGVPGSWSCVSPGQEPQGDGHRGEKWGKVFPQISGVGQRGSRMGSWECPHPPGSPTNPGVLDVMGAGKHIPSTWVSFQVVIRLFSRSIWDTWSSSICRRKGAQGGKGDTWSQCGVGYGLRTRGQDGGMQEEAEMGSIGGYKGRQTEPAWRGLAGSLR